MRDWDGTCQRCRKETAISIMSKFNTQQICPECEKLEKGHASYKRASDAEMAAVRRGDYNFPGIGKPVDL